MQRNTDGAGDMTDLAQSNCIKHEDIQLAGAPQAVLPLESWGMLKQLLLPIVLLSAFVGACMQLQFGNIESKIRKQRLQLQEQPEQGSRLCSLPFDLHSDALSHSVAGCPLASLLNVVSYHRPELISDCCSFLHQAPSVCLTGTALPSCHCQLQVWKKAGTTNIQAQETSCSCHLKTFLCHKRI